MKRASSLSLCLILLCLHVAAAGTYVQNFNTNAQGWVFYNSAQRLSKQLQLNPAQSYVEGQAWWQSLMPCQSFTADFRFRLSSTNGDGMTFGWVSQVSPELGESGSLLGAYYCGYGNHHVHGYDGYFIEIDTYAFIDESGVPVPHIALCRSHYDRQRDQLVYAHAAISGGAWYDMRVKVSMTDVTTARVQVWYDATPDGTVDELQTPILDYSLTNYAMSRAYFGFTGGTGNSYEEHCVDNFGLTVPTGDGTIHAPEWVEIRPRTITDDTRLKAVAFRAWDPDGLRLFFDYAWMRSLDGGATWLRRGRNQVLLASRTEPGERWRCDVRAWNGFTYSTWCSSPTVTIPDNPASVLALSGTCAGTRSGQTQLIVTLSQPAVVRASIHNVAGRPVALLPEQSLQAGISSLFWNGRNLTGSRVPRGQYLVNLHATTEAGASQSCLLKLMR